MPSNERADLEEFWDMNELVKSLENEKSENISPEHSRKLISYH